MRESVEAGVIHADFIQGPPGKSDGPLKCLGFGGGWGKMRDR